MDGPLPRGISPCQVQILHFEARGIEEDYEIPICKQEAVTATGWCGIFAVDEDKFQLLGANRQRK